MSHRTELLELERRKLLLLRHKLVEQERRVQTLEQMQDDPLDELLERELAQATAVQTPVQAQRGHQEEATEIDIPEPPSVPSMLPMAATWQRIPRRIPPQWARLLSYIGSDGKSFAEVEAFIKNEDLALTPGAARTGLMNYRKDFGFVENPRKGFYKATDKALAFIEAHKDESPAIDDGEAFESQPTPLARAEA